MAKLLAGFRKRLNAVQIARIQPDRRLARNRADGGQKRLDPGGETVWQFGNGVPGALAGEMQNGVIDARAKRRAVDFSQFGKACAGSFECLYGSFQLCRCLGAAGGAAFFHTFGLAFLKTDAAALFKSLRTTGLKINLRCRGWLALGNALCVTSFGVALGFHAVINARSIGTGSIDTGLGIFSMFGVGTLTIGRDRSTVGTLILSHRTGSHRGTYLVFTTTLRRHGDRDKRTGLKSFDGFHRNPFGALKIGVVRQRHKALDFRILELACRGILGDGGVERVVQLFLMCVAG